MKNRSDLPFDAPLFEVEFPGKPVPQPRPRITRQGGKYYPKQYNAVRQALVLTFKQAHKGPPLGCLMRLEVGLAGARANSDLSNHLKSIEDALVQAGVIADDCVKYLGEVRAETIEGDPRTRVTLYRLS